MDSSALKAWSVPVALVGLVLLVGVNIAPAEDFAGVGLHVVPISSGELVVLRVIEKGPAFAGGMRPGDLIVSVDGFALAGSDFAEVVPKYLWGAPGSTVTLDFLRPGECDPRSATIRRVPMQPKGIDTPGVKTILPQ